MGLQPQILHQQSAIFWSQCRLMLGNCPSKNVLKKNFAWLLDVCLFFLGRYLPTGQNGQMSGFIEKKSSLCQQWCIFVCVCVCVVACDDLLWHYRFLFVNYKYQNKKKNKKMLVNRTRYLCLLHVFLKLIAHTSFKINKIQYFFNPLTHAPVFMFFDLK